jgi:hypothetical protein
MLFADNQQELLQLLGSGDGAEYLKKLWDQLADDESTRIHASEFRVENRSLPNNYLAIVIKFPKTYESHEAEFAGILCNLDPTSNKKDSVRYLTFDSSIIPGFSATTMKTEWKTGGVRRSLGVASDSSMRGMFEQLQKFIPLDRRGEPTTDVTFLKTNQTPPYQDAEWTDQILDVKDDRFEFRYRNRSLSFRAVEHKSWGEFLPRACVVSLSVKTRIYQKSEGGRRMGVKNHNNNNNSSRRFGMSEVSISEFEECASLVPGSSNDMANMILRQGHSTRFPTRLRYPFTFRKRASSAWLQTSSPVFFDMDAEIACEYAALQDATVGLTHSPIRRIQIEKWIVGEAERYKGNGGMEAQVLSDDVYVYQIKPDKSQMNVTPPVFIVGALQIFFLPHCMMFREGSSAKFIFYETVTCSVLDLPMTFPNAPQGVTILDHTWTFMNKDGGPDRRYSDNPLIPIVAVAELRFDFVESKSRRFIFSDREAAKGFCDAITKLSMIARQATED